MAERRWVSPLLLIIPLVMVATLGLGLFSYRSAARLSRQSIAALENTTGALGSKLVDRIERVIIDTDRAFFRLVRVDDPTEFRELWRRITRLSSTVEAVAVLDRNGDLVHLVTKLGAKATKDFRRVFLEKIVPDLGLPSLAVEHHKHLHKRYDQKPYLMSYIRRRSGERDDYFIVLSINVGHIHREIFKREFRDLAGSYRVAVADEEGRNLYGNMRPGPSYTFEANFPTTLYKWRLQLAPVDVAARVRSAEERRNYGVVLVAGAVGITWLGLIIMVLAMRKERRANQLKSEFIANVSHELKTPLSLIRMFGELSANPRSDQARRSEYAEIITRESDRLSGLIDNVLDFARIERGKAAYQMAPGDLLATISSAVELCRYRAEQAGLSLCLEMPESLPMTRYDESAITLAVINLVENAIKYAAPAEGSPVEANIDVHVERAGSQVVVTIRDQGPGIPPDEQSRVFERFFRGKRARAEAQRGSGIGLSLVKHVVEAHNGDVRVESEAGNGATFRVSLPLDSAS